MKKFVLFFLAVLLTVATLPAMQVSASSNQDGLTPTLSVVLTGLNGVDNIYVNALEKPSTMRDWGTNGTGYGEKFSDKPFALAGLSNDVQRLSLTDQWGKTYYYAFHDKNVCQSIPELTLSKSGSTTTLSVKNYTDQTVQISLRLENQIDPAGLLHPGGSAEIQSDKQWGGLEVRAEQPGSLCAEISWDNRAVPAPHVLFVTKGYRTDRSVLVQGDNFETYQPGQFNPDSYLLMFIKPDWTGSAFSFRQTIWENRLINIDLPENFVSDNYLIKVSVPISDSQGISSNGVQYQYTAPYINEPPLPPTSFKIYLPLVVK